MNKDDVNKIWYVADSMHYLASISICDNTSYKTALTVAQDIKSRCDNDTAAYITEAFYGQEEAEEALKTLNGLVH